MDTKTKSKRSFSIAATITLIYIAASLLWIYLSDPFLLTLTRDPDLVSHLQSQKGTVYVLIIAAMLYVMIRVLTGRLESSLTKTALAYQDTIDALLGAIELRDVATGSHSERVVSVALALAREMGLPEKKLEAMAQGALLHDIGKIGVPDEILQKPGKLTNQEWLQMKIHAHRGYKLLQSVVHLKAAAIIPLRHHERWDGSGYPDGLKGKAIPLEARIFAVVDVWDALISDRPYRKAWPKEKAFDYILENSGVQFDPAVVEAFVKLKQNKLI